LRRRLDGIFRTNLAAGAAIKASSETAGHPAASILDDDRLSYWQASEGARSAAIEVDLGEEVRFDVALFQENIRLGQRVEGFSLQAWNGSEWVPFAGGTTIGYKRLLRFPATAARKVRLVISKSRAEPALSAFGLFSSSIAPGPSPTGGNGL
jgi:alpha-L-fucosidase